jgi:hypothetical protein
VYFLLLVSLVSLRIPSTNPSSPAEVGYITVTGRWLYHFNATYTLPVIWAIVQIFDLEPDGHPYPVGSPVLTDGNGYFNSGPILNDDGLGEDGLDIVVGVFATSLAVAVINPNTDYYYYNLTTTVWLNRPDGTLNVGDLNTSYAERGAWLIFSYHFGLTRGWYYLSNTVGYNTPAATARWPHETWPHYHPSGEIHLPDWAAWWPDIIVHEYGHHVMYSLYGYIPSSMEEHYMELRSNSTTAWTEGWADFFPLAVFNRPTFTLGINATHGIEYNLESKHWCSSGWDDGDLVEGRVAGALWDIFDSTNDGYDSLSDGFTRIWSVISSQTDNTFREFWQAWNASSYPKQSALMAIFQNSIDYRGLGDVNADGDVDILDSQIVANAFGSRKGSSNFDQRADLNYDDRVNILDAIIVGNNFGKHYDC